MKDFAIAISVYDKFRDVKVLCDIFRENWAGRFDLVVCSSHPDAPRALADCDLDELLAVDGIPMDGPAVNDVRVSPRARLWARVIDSVRKTCDRAAARRQARFTLHVHADSCPLSWPKLRTLAETMLRHGQRFAARGEGFGFYTWNEPVGGFDDMFFIVDNEFAADTGLWEFEPCDFLPHKVSIHGALALLALTRVGASRVYHFGTHAESVYWDGRPVVLYPLNSAHPMYYDPCHDFLHIHETAFDGDLGMRLKAHYLHRHGITRGRHVESYLAEWLTDASQLFAALASSERALRRFFHRRGLSPAPYGRSFDQMLSVKTAYARMDAGQRAAWLLRQHGRQLKGAIAAPLRRTLRGRGAVATRVYADSIWPGSLDQVYHSLFGRSPSDVTVTR